MNNTKISLNPRLVQIISADIFWNYVYQHSFQEADQFANRGEFPADMLSAKNNRETFTKPCKRRGAK